MFFHCKIIGLIPAKKSILWLWQWKQESSHRVQKNSRIWPMFGHPEMRIYQKQNPLQPSAHAACQLLITLHSSQAPPPSTNHSTSITLLQKHGLGEWSLRLSEPDQSMPSGQNEWNFHMDGLAACETKGRIIWSWFIRLQSRFKHFSNHEIPVMFLFFMWDQRD